MQTADVMEQSKQMADTFLERLRELDPAARARIQATAGSSSRYTGALMETADELTTLKNKDRSSHLGEFIVNVERRIAEMQLSPALDRLAKAAVRAILVHHLPNRDAATKLLYEPFEQAIPVASLGSVGAKA